MRRAEKEAATRKDAIFGTREAIPFLRFTVLHGDVLHATSAGHSDDGKSV